MSAQPANEGSPPNDFAATSTSLPAADSVQQAVGKAAKGVAHAVHSTLLHADIPADGICGFSQSQALVLAALADTLVAALNPEETARLVATTQSVRNAQSLSDDVISFAQISGGTMELVKNMIDYLHKAAHPDQLQSVQTALWVLSTGPGCFLLTGSSTPVHRLDRSAREKVVSKLFHSPLAALRALVKSIYGMVILNTYGEPKLGKGRNPFLKVIGYPEGPHVERPLPDPADIWRPSFLDLQGLVGPNDSEEIRLACDIVVVGSGAGGGVVAGELAQAGHDVLVLEKAFYTHPSELPYTPKASFELLFERSGALGSEDGSMQVLTGNAWGGGTAVNWSASLRLPSKVREEWATKYKLPYFMSLDYANAVDAVCTRVGVSTDAIEHNASNSLLLEGLARLGMPHGVIPQNTDSQSHECGFCCFGCPYGTKQGTHLTFLRDAAESGNARFIEGCTVDRVLHKGGRAVGVKGTVIERGTGRTRKIMVKAKKVVVSAGSLHSPAILLRSGLRNPNIGKHLRLHPCTHVFGIFRNSEKPINTYSGSIMTVLGTPAENAHGDGYGSKLEISCMHPAMFASCVPWRSAEEHKRLLALYDRMVPVLVIGRDSDATKGRVYLDKTGTPRIEYTISPKDQISLAAGVEAGIKALIAAGATEIITNQRGVDPFSIDPEKINDIFTSKEFGNYLAKVRKWGFQPTWTPLFTAHQMGTCRMAGSASQGACNPDGRTWEVDGLYVADASLFPTASGVNPMVTTLSLGYAVAQRVKESLQSTAKL
ncbi:uncharacterized protein SPPG_02052 [Spizellomyces punctatus DAOM BR117]|uniref:Long-chain-alcohol oxidase n=1 Tax=Spizellomyces punctatus (strain DAOM BR117) TaxID=645134 RepID=A0A0L0HPF7_SPIPD|nr:uncharacterized protein SPPG_02052 [Spizellomyces punctatus DAOM BR117]KND02977.1 hypothetical protein SPPG_02052 [Spizellomyces punctatus DAOM BR117]|eukprot:XP_016611016.1 hypothetical protein SPPG_02052 [Spizellomyces punctatus DAOM BR117]